MQSIYYPPHLKVMYSLKVEALIVFLTEILHNIHSYYISAVQILKISTEKVRN